jgi:hypothetical protein
VLRQDGLDLALSDAARAPAARGLAEAAARLEDASRYRLAAAFPAEQARVYELR